VQVIEHGILVDAAECGRIEQEYGGECRIDHAEQEQEYAERQGRLHAESLHGFDALIYAMAVATYKDSGVDIAAGDAASKAAYRHAASTFASRKGMIGQPVEEEDGYAGLLDMGDYYLVQSDDSTGSKIDLAFAMSKLDTLGYDLVAMVADDAVCTGAESISISNTLDVPKVDVKQIDALLKGLAAACSEQKIVIPAGEIAEVPGAVARGVWSATVVGVVAKDRLLQTKSITEGDAIVALKSGVARSNGFSLIRKILSDKFGEQWYDTEWKNSVSWGEIFLTPSIIYSAAMLKLIGRYGEERAIDVRGLAHITGGGIPSKLRRVLKASGCGADLTDLWTPHEALTDLIDLGNVPVEEAYRTWNMGNGMLAIVADDDAEKTVKLLKKEGIDAQVAGHVTQESRIQITTYTGETIVV
jgi:phosphoribosylformylglycinamidine cyclo-ligase